MASDLLNLLKTASAADLYELEMEITKLTGQVDQLQNEIIRLKALWEMINIAVNGAPEKPMPKKRGRRPKAEQSAPATPAPEQVREAPATSPDSTPSRLGAIARYLQQHKQALSTVIADALDIPHNSMGYYLAKPGFARNGRFYTLTEEGKNYLAL